MIKSLFFILITHSFYILALHKEKISPDVVNEEIIYQGDEFEITKVAPLFYFYSGTFIIC